MPSIFIAESIIIIQRICSICILKYRTSIKTGTIKKDNRTIPAIHIQSIRLNNRPSSRYIDLMQSYYPVTKVIVRIGRQKSCDLGVVIPCIKVIQVCIFKVLISGVAVRLPAAIVGTWEQPAYPRR